MSNADARHRNALDQLRELSTLQERKPDFLHAALGIICEGVQVPMGKVLELVNEGTLLVVRAGVGWRDGVAGHATVPANAASIAGYSLTQTGVIIFSDVSGTSRFTDAHLLRSHGVRSSLAARVLCKGEPWGVLTLHEQRRRRFSPHDIDFTKAAALQLGDLIATSAARSSRSQPD